LFLMRKMELKQRFILFGHDATLLKEESAAMLKLIAILKFLLRIKRRQNDV
jgi:hypothetical protein